MACEPPPTFNDFPADGGTVTFTFTFAIHGTFNAVDVLVAAPESTVFIEQDPTTFSVNRQTRTVTFNTAPAAGSTVRIQRCTNRERLQDYQSGSTILADENLDAEGHQIFDILQEVEGSSPTTIIIGGTVTDISEPAVYEFEVLEVEGETDFFLFNGDHGATKNIVRAQAFVFVDNVFQPPQFTDPIYDVLQEDRTGYPTGDAEGEDVVRFAEAVPLGALVRVVVFRGAVVAAIPDGFITGDMIGADEIDLTHFGIGAGVDTRVLVFGTSGDAPVARQLSPADIVDTGDLSAALAAAIIAGVNLNDLAADGSVSFGNNKATNLASGTATGDAITKGQLDTKVRIHRETFPSSDLNGTKTVITGFRAHIVLLVVDTTDNYRLLFAVPFANDGSTLDKVRVAASGDFAQFDILQQADRVVFSSPVFAGFTLTAALAQFVAIHIGS